MKIFYEEIEEELQIKKDETGINKLIDKYSLEALEYYTLKDKYNEMYRDKLFGAPAFSEFYSQESAFSKNPSILRNAYLRTSMLLSINKDISIAKYLESLTYLDTLSIKHYSSNTVFGYDNIVAFDNIMEVIDSLSNFKIDDNEIRSILAQVSRDVEELEIDYLLTLLSLGIPIIGLLVTIMLLIKIKSDVNKFSEYNALYSDKLLSIINASIKKSNLSKKIGSLGSEDNFSLITKLSSYINKQRQIMFPSSIKNSIKPKLLKTKRAISYEDKVSVVELLKRNYKDYITVLSGKPSNKLDAARLILKGSDIESSFYYGISTNSVTESGALGDICLNLILTLLELTDFVIILVQDLKRY